MGDKLIGNVTHYFDKIGVAVLKLNDNLKIGNSIKIVDNAGQETTQAITSMQIDHQVVELAKSGQEVAIKVDIPVKAGAKVYLI